MDEETKEQTREPGREKAPSSAVPFTLGLLSLLSAFILAPVSLVLGIIGIVKANKFKRLALSDGKSDAGWVLSLLGIIFSSIGMLFWLPFLPFLVLLPFSRLWFFRF